MMLIRNVHNPCFQVVSQCLQVSTASQRQRLVAELLYAKASAPSSLMSCMGGGVVLAKIVQLNLIDDKRFLLPPPRRAPPPVAVPAPPTYTYTYTAWSTASEDAIPGRFPSTQTSGFPSMDPTCAIWFPTQPTEQQTLGYRWF